MVKTTEIKFVKTSPSKLVEVQEQYPNSFIHVPQGDGTGDLYIGSNKITSKLVVNTFDELLSIAYPYKGMVVNIKGSPELWILVGDDSTNRDSWAKVAGDNDEIQGILDRLESVETNITGIQDDVSGLQITVADLSTGLGEVMTSVESISTEITDIKASVTGLGEEITSVASDLNSSISSLSESLDITQEDILSIGSDLSYIHISLAALSNGLGSTQDEVSTLKTQVSQAESDINDLQNGLDEVKSDVIDIKDRLNDFLTSSDLNDYVKTEDLEGYLTPEDIQDLASKSDLEGYVKVEDAVDFLTASDLEGYLKVSELPVNVSDFINDAGYITENDLPDYLLDSDLDNLKDDLNEIKDKVTNIESGLGDVQDDVTRIDTSVSELREDVTQAQSDIESVSSDVAEISGVVETIGSELTELSGVVSQAQSDISTLGENLTTAQSDIENIQNNISDIESEISSIGSDISGLRDDVSQNQSDISSLQSEVSTITSAVSQNTEDIEELSTNLDSLTDLVGTPEDGEDPATGIFEELDELNRKVKGASLGTYTLPVMTPEMVEAATEDEDVEFDGDEDSYILVENDMQPTQAQGDAYLGLIQDMTRAIRALQAEVARLKNSFDYGIDSYTDTRTAKSTQLGLMEDVEEVEPLWAIDPQIGMSLVPDSQVFNTLLDINHRFTKKGTGTIDVSVEGQLTFVDCKGVFSDGDENGENLTLYELKDSKLITYLVTDKPDIKMTLVSIDDKTNTREIEFAPLLQGNSVNKYGFCVVISRKVKTSETIEKGFNYIYFSIINYETDEKLYEGYLTNNGQLVDTRISINERFTIQSLEFDRLTLSRMKFYTKYEDFSEEVIPSAPSEDDYKYEVAHIAIRSVKDNDMLNSVASHLRDNELVWNKEAKTLHIKSDGKVYLIGSNKQDDNNKDKYMTDKQIIEALGRMGLIVNDVVYEKDEDGNDIVKSFGSISMNPIADITFINSETNKKFTFTVDTEGNLVGKDNSFQTIEEFMEELQTNAGNYDATDYKAVRGFTSDYLFRRDGTYNLKNGVNYDGDAGNNSDRLRISSFYAPITTDEVHGCTHSFIELENSSDKDIPLTGIYLHFYNPAENDYHGFVHHLALDGVIKAGGTYLIRGAKHAEFDDESAFIKVRTFDKEWYENGQPVSFEQEKVKTVKTINDKGETVEEVASDSNVKTAYRFCLTYGLPTLAADTKLVERNPAKGSVTIDGTTYDATTYPDLVVNPRFIDSCSYSTFSGVSAQTGIDNPWYLNGDEAGIGITITANSMYRIMFALDPAKQAYNGFNTKDSSRVRYNKATDIQILKLDKEFIGYPHSKEIIKIDRYTPKASFENRNIMTDKSQLNKEKPNMVTCSFGVDVYNTRCFNWISCGAFDEYVWIREQGTTAWNKFQSYTKVSANTPENHTKSIYRKEYLKDVNNVVYARMINRFPGNDILFTSHKCVVVLPDAQESPVKYEYVVGRPDKDGKPDPEHTNSIYTFTVYPRTYEGRMYQITDQQGFHWIEYQVWSAAAEYLNTKIDAECAAINATEGKTKVFPILMNTGDMTQSGARINEWLDYYNGGVSLFDHLEQMNCVGNNDLCPIDPRKLGTGNDTDKSSSHFFHYFYCFDVRDTEMCTEEDVSTEDTPNRFIYTGEKFFTGESLIVKAHTGSVTVENTTTNINITEDKYIPSLYYYKTGKILYVVVNSEIPISNCQKWFGLCSNGHNYVNIYTGIEIINNGSYVGGQLSSYEGYFTPVYETIYAWLNNNKIKDGNDEFIGDVRRVVVAMHEMPFTVITNASLANAKPKQLSATRNHPLGKAARVGSNTNQLSIDENRGIYWCSRLLEYFGCKLVIGGHKHTYALSHPIKEKYSWTKHEIVPGTENEEIWYDSKDVIKPMLATLADEAGTTPTNLVSWDIDLSTNENRIEYNITESTSEVSTSTKLNSTKTPYVPEHLFNDYSKDVYNASKSGLFRCCTPIDITGNTKYDGFVTYSMCQATGYKLKSNKELPASTQVFSKIIPLTSHGKNKITDAAEDKPNANQLYPMYAVLEFNDNCSELTITMNRVTNIFSANGKDTFNQTSYGKNAMGLQMLCTFEKEDCNSFGTFENKPASPANGYLYFATDENKVYKYVIDNGVGSWVQVNERMYGKWLSETAAKNRANAYIADQQLPTPTGVSDNRYLHIIF